MDLSDPTIEASSLSSDDRTVIPGFFRQTVDFLIILSLSIILFRTFAAEAYIVPTGSMAPTLLGNHREIVCPNCAYRFTMGVDEGGHAGRPTCPNCGQSSLENVQAIECNGDRVLVQKFMFDVRRPKRWEVSVFHFPGDPSQAYVKRVVGLPGESVQIHGGDVLIDGSVARKSLREQRAMRILIFDNNFVPKDSARFPRWRFRRGWAANRLSSGWRLDGTRLVHEPIAPSNDQVDWLEYRHWDPDRGRYSPPHDFHAYNGSDLRGENLIADLMFEARVAPSTDVKAVSLRLDSGSDRFMIDIPVGSDGKVIVRRRGRILKLLNVRDGFQAVKPGSAGQLLEASVMDRRLTVAIDGVLLFDPIDYNDPAVGPGPGESPIGVGVKNGSLTLSDIKLFRDVYYTNALAFSPRLAFGVDRPYTLGADEFFVLGDNSAVSNDSRFWTGSPVVPGELFLGKPFLVHLPGQAVPLQVFGRSLYWVPDPREIRYIR